MAKAILNNSIDSASDHVKIARKVAKKKAIKYKWACPIFVNGKRHSTLYKMKESEFHDAYLRYSKKYSSDLVELGKPYRIK